jgi:hypothetical protein
VKLSTVDSPGPPSSSQHLFPLSTFSLGEFKYIGGMLPNMEFFHVISFTAFSGVGIVLTFDKRLILTRTCGTSLASLYKTSILYSYFIVQFLSLGTGMNRSFRV